MKASDLRPGQEFRFLDHRIKMIRVQGGFDCVYYVDTSEWHVCQCLKDTPVTGWDDEPQSEPREIQAGDWVVCVRPYTDTLISGNLYRVLKASPEWLTLENVPSSWGTHRFRLATAAEIDQHAGRAEQ